MTLTALRDKAQKEFNKFIRNRDQFKQCISCFAAVTEAGHFFSAGHHTGLRFNEVNVNGQCTRCNCFLHGNLIHYRNGLVKRYGQQKVALLESAATRNKIHRWTRPELEIIYKTYREKNKLIEVKKIPAPKTELTFHQKL